MTNHFSYVSYYKKLQIYIGRPETILEASLRYDQEKQHAQLHPYFCKASYCVYHTTY